MALKDLTSETMTVISRDWLDPAKERPILARLSRVAPLIVDLEIAHHDLITHQQPAPKVTPELAALNQKASELDARHDRLARGVYAIVEGLVELRGDTDEGDVWRTVQAELFPQGKSITRRSYIDQAGEATRIDGRLSERSRRLLEELMLGRTPLMAYVRQWQEAGIELGRVEKERILLAKEEPATPTVAKVRNAWIRAVNAILAMLDLEQGLSEADRRRVIEPLESALAKAEARKRSSTVVEAKAEAEEAGEEKAG